MWSLIAQTVPTPLRWAALGAVAFFVIISWQRNDAVREQKLKIIEQNRELSEKSADAAADMRNCVLNGHFYDFAKMRCKGP